MRGISRLAANQLASQEGLCTMGQVSNINDPDASNGRLHVTLRQYACDPLRSLVLVSLYIKTRPRNRPRFSRYPPKSFHITSHTLPHSLSSTLLSLAKVSWVHCSCSHRSHKKKSVTKKRSNFIPEETLPTELLPESQHSKY